MLAPALLLPLVPRSCTGRMARLLGQFHPRYRNTPTSHEEGISAPVFHVLPAGPLLLLLLLVWPCGASSPSKKALMFRCTCIQAYTLKVYP